MAFMLTLKMQPSQIQGIFFCHNPWFANPYIFAILSYTLDISNHDLQGDPHHIRPRTGLNYGFRD